MMMNDDADDDAHGGGGRGGDVKVINKSKCKTQNLPQTHTLPNACTSISSSFYSGSKFQSNESNSNVLVTPVLAKCKHQRKVGKTVKPPREREGERERGRARGALLLEN